MGGAKPRVTVQVWGVNALLGYERGPIRSGVWHVLLQPNQGNGARLRL